MIYLYNSKNYKYYFMLPKFIQISTGNKVY